MVTYRGRKCELSVNLGGITGPGSRPKGTEEPGIFYVIGGNTHDSLGRTESKRSDRTGDRRR